MLTKKLIPTAIGALFAMGVSANEIQVLEPSSQSSLVPNSYIVVFNTPEVLNASADQAIQEFATLQGAQLENQFNVKVQKHFGDVLNGVLVKATKSQIQALQQSASVKYVEQEQWFSVNPIPPANALVNQAGDQAGATWGLDRVDQRDLPLNSNYHYDVDGSGVTAYVIDTGVLNTHVDFGGRASSGYDFIDDDNDATDCNGHGTHVAGTIGGSTWGVAKNVNIVGVRVLSCFGFGTTSGVLAGINWVKDNASGPSVANMSLGGSKSQALDDAVDAAVESGVTFVVAAGNDTQDACNFSPAAAEKAITVGSTEVYAAGTAAAFDMRSNFSNFGSCVDIFAPGSDITSAWVTSNSSSNTISGTSMAAPHVAGAAALLLDEDDSMTPEDIEQTLTARATDGKIFHVIGSPNKLLYTINDNCTDCGGDDGDDGDGGGEEPQEPGIPELTSGKTVQINGAQNSETQYVIKVPEGAQSLNLQIAGGTGDADLYVKHGSEATQSNWDCRPYRWGNYETCYFDHPAEGEWYVMVRGYYNYSNVGLTGTITMAPERPEVPECDGGNCLENDIPVTDISGARNSETIYKIDVPAGRQLRVEISGGKGDADLYVRAGEKPTTSQWDCRPYRWGNHETCTINSETDQTVYIMIRGYYDYSGLQLIALY